MSMILQEAGNGFAKTNLGDFYGQYPKPWHHSDACDTGCDTDNVQDEMGHLSRVIKSHYTATVKEVADGVPSCLACRRQAQNQSTSDNTSKDVIAPGADVPTSVYRYEALSDPSSSIRVLKLLPATSEDAPLCGELFVCCDRAPTNFAALSYTWTGIEDDSILYLQTGELVITGNLDRALRALRKKDVALDIWIDAVCINQQDNKEKGLQVAQMAEIYKCAEIVLAWLGPATIHTKEAVDFLTQTADLGIRKYKDNIKTLETPLAIKYTRIPLTDDEALWINSAQKSAHVEDICTRLWFKRLWVVQEVLLAKCIKLHIGSNVLPWKTFGRALKMMLSADHHFAEGIHQDAGAAWDPSGPLVHAHLLSNKRDYFESLKLLPTIFEDYTYWTYGMVKDLLKWGCKDHRDRIYAILGFIHDDCRIVVRPDYEATPEQIYTEFAREHLRKEGLHLLLSAGLETRCKDDIDAFNLLLRQPTGSSASGNVSWSGMPQMLSSWAPEPRPEKRRTPYCGRNWTPAVFATATNRAPAVVLHKTCPHIIAVRGCVFDSVIQPLPISIIQPLSDGIELMDYMHALKYVLFVWQFSKDHFKDKGDYPTGESHRTVFQKVLTSDGTASSLDLLSKRKDPSWIDRMFDLLIKVADTRSASVLETSLSTGLIEQEELLIFLGAVARNLSEDHVVITENGLMGLAPNLHRGGDVIAWINHLAAPVLLRPLTPDGPYWLVGPCFIHGVMHGELDDRGSDEDVTTFLELI